MESESGQKPGSDFLGAKWSGGSWSEQDINCMSYRCHSQIIGTPKQKVQGLNVTIGR